MAIDGAINLGDSGNTGIQTAGLTVAGISYVSAVYSGDLTLAQPTLAGSLEGPLKLPLASLAASAVNGSAARGALLLLAPAVAGQALTGNAGAAALPLPLLAVNGSFGAAGDVSLADLTLAAQGVGGSAATGQLLLAGFSTAASAAQDNSAAGAASLQPLQLAGALDASVVSNADLALAPPGVDAVAVAGNVMSASLTVPLVSLGADGYADITGSATLTLPVLQLHGQAAQDLAAPRVTAIVLNTRNGAVTTYAGLGANSLCNFNGITLAATADGIVALSGDDDAGAPIAASVSGAVSDFGSATFKRVLAGYVGYRADGELELTLVTDSHHEYVYQLAPRQLGEQHASRVKFGRGIDGRYWQWRLANSNGAGFALDSLMLDVQELRKRIG